MHSFVGSLLRFPDPGWRFIIAAFLHATLEKKGGIVLWTILCESPTGKAAEVVVTTGTVVDGTNLRGADQDAPVTLEEEGGLRGSSGQPGKGAGARDRSGSGSSSNPLDLDSKPNDDSLMNNAIEVSTVLRVCSQQKVGVNK